jgi:hypothetical protein
MIGMAASVKGLRWWMRVVGALYVLLFVMASIARVPIREEGPPGVLDLAAAGNPVANFVIDTWFTFGIFLGVVGIALMVASRTPEQARALVWTLLGLEVGGIVADVYKIARGYHGAPYVWIVVYIAIIATGLRSLGSGREQQAGQSSANLMGGSGTTSR